MLELTNPCPLPFVACLDQLSAFFRFVVPSNVAQGTQHPCVAIFEHMWQIIEGLFAAYADCTPVAESLARLFRNTMESYTTHMFPLLGELRN